MAWWFFFPIAFFFGGLILIVVLITLAAITIFSNRGSWSGRSYSGRVDPALQIIKERYAKGEITKEQFEQMTKDLGH